MTKAELDALAALDPHFSDCESESGSPMRFGPCDCEAPVLIGLARKALSIEADPRNVKSAGAFIDVTHVTCNEEIDALAANRDALSEALDELRAIRAELERERDALKAQAEKDRVQVAVLVEALRKSRCPDCDPFTEDPANNYCEEPLHKTAFALLANLPAAAREHMERVEKLEAVARAARETLCSSCNYWMTHPDRPADCPEELHAALAALDAKGGAK